MQESSLFDEMARVERRPKREAESLFDYYNSSGRTSVDALRKLLDAWFARLPAEARTAVRARIRSSDDISFHSAFFELYMHELMLSMGYSLDYEPDIPSSSNHPDFRVSRRGTALFFLEATIAAASRDEQAMDKRAAVVYDTLNQLDSPNFFLQVRVTGAPRTPPQGARLRADLKNWLRSLDPEAIARQIQEGGREDLPEYEWRHDGWELSFSPIPKSPESRGKPDVRPIGSRIWAGWVASHEPIRAALTSKAKKYRGLQIPLLIAINVLDESAENIDSVNALCGEEGVSFAVHADLRSSEPRDVRLPNGAWRGPRGPRARDVSGVVIVYHLNPWRIGCESPRLFHHPWARRPLDSVLWPFEQWLPNTATGRYEVLAGKNAADVLGLPTPWPPVDD